MSNEYVTKLKALAKQKLDYHSEILAKRLLFDERFSTWSGSAKPEHHHYGNGQLAKHTWEVVHLCFVNKEALNLDSINDNELFLAALFHDAGKMWDYVRTDNPKLPWTGTEHKRLIHHISRSGVYWSNTFEQLPNVNRDLHDPVLHAILAHHGSREWGSPVAPKTQVAWLLHLCDNISARMDDWNKMDIVKH